MLFAIAGISSAVQRGRQPASIRRRAVMIRLRTATLCLGLTLATGCGTTVPGAETGALASTGDSLGGRSSAGATGADQTTVGGSVGSTGTGPSAAGLTSENGSVGSAGSAGATTPGSSGAVTR